jgi:hypothetical protein
MLTDMDNGIPQWVPSKSPQVRVNAHHLPISYTSSTDYRLSIITCPYLTLAGQPRSLWPAMRLDILEALAKKT